MTALSRAARALSIASAIGAAAVGACSPSQSSSTLAGKVILDGAPDSSGVILLVAGRLQNEDSVVTAADGSYLFHISSEKDQRYTVSAFAPWTIERVAGTYIDVKAGESPTLADIHMTAIGDVSGTVTLAGSAAGSGGVVVSAQGTSAVAVSADDGTFLMRDVPAGTVTLRASRAGYAEAVVPGVSVAYAKTSTAPAITLAAAK